ncbi:type II toxin-antitoxin system HicA family toxin, partial [Microcystis aeruginosa]|uniref:hypothetical protein n=1 Tax=Microcystis aeruginosa TaxID=1126 RepID=UPI001C11554C
EQKQLAKIEAMSFYIRVPSLITPVHCITQTEEPSLNMPKLKQLSGKDVIKILARFGFTIAFPNLMRYTKILTPDS